VQSAIEEAFALAYEEVKERERDERRRGPKEEGPQAPRQGPEGRPGAFMGSCSDIIFHLFD
jgi:hypothetical protein